MGNCASSGISAPAEEDLHLVPGRIFSNDDGNSKIKQSSSIYTQQGLKGINQDSMILWEDFGGGGILCGVFDGHGPHGHLVSRKVRDALPLKLLSHLPRSPPPTSSSSLSAWRRAFVSSCKAMDKDLRSNPAIDCFCSGTTAVTLLKMGSHLFLSNIGDSRAVLGSLDPAGGSMLPMQLTVDLKPDLPREAERIKRCRGRVFALQDEPEVPRVWLPFDDAPGLAMARAFGDFCLKDYGVISVPDFSHWIVTDRDRFVVLASDGVWDVLSNNQVVDIVSSSPTRSSAAKFLINAATREWKLKYPTSKMDDCAVVCLYLDHQTADSDSVVVEKATSAWCTEEECSTGPGPGPGPGEPTLERNITVRSGGSTMMMVQQQHTVDEENGCHGVAIEDQKWSGLEGVTRVNSIVQLPRFSVDKA